MKLRKIYNSSAFFIFSVGTLLTFGIQDLSHKGFKNQWYGYFMVMFAVWSIFDFIDKKKQPS